MRRAMSPVRSASTVLPEREVGRSRVRSPSSRWAVVDQFADVVGHAVDRLDA